ncbi:MAG: hypothetical protein NC223_06575 [Butyrivibrio sp.]|nr:hypothetical protein [Butyrivibrio sp.]
MRINCFGDSLTAGTAWGNRLSYPTVLAGLTGLEVNNYGIGGESSFTVASRLGAQPLKLLREVELPSAAGSEARVELGDVFGQPSGVLLQVREDTGDDCLNPVSLGGVSGRLVRREDALYFVRENDGAPLVLKAGECVETRLSRKDYSEDINIFWVGTNDRASTDNAVAVIANLRAMIDFTASGKYIVIGLTALNTMPQLAQVNEMLEEAFGRHFCDIRKYILGLEPIKENNPFYEQDMKDLEKGEIPISYMKAPTRDHVHCNEKFYALLGAQLYAKLKELSYI